MNAPSERDAELENRFTYHQPNEDQVHRYALIRAQGHNMALIVTQSCPDSREKSLAITKLEEAVMWANAAIARNE